MNITKYIPLIVLFTLAICAGVLSNPKELFAGPAQGPYVVNPSATSSAYNGIDGSNGQAAIKKNGEQYIDTVESIKTPVQVATIASGFPVNIGTPAAFPTTIPFEITVIPMATVLATAVPAALGTPPVTNAVGWKYAYVNNITNQPVWCAFSGSTNIAFPVPAGGYWWKDFKVANTKVTGGIACMRATLPTSGELDIGGW